MAWSEMNGVLNFSVLDGWWYEGYHFDEQAGWALTEKRTFTDQTQQDKLDAATIYSMLENEIVPLYFRKNSAGYSPDWIQYIKRSIGHIAPHFTMQRQLDDYISRFYLPESKRARKLEAKDYEKARRIVEWKEHVASLWEQIKVVNVLYKEPFTNGVTLRMGQPIDITVTLDTHGLGADIAVEMVVYKQKEGQFVFDHIEPFHLEKSEGELSTYIIRTQIKESGNFQIGLRYYPTHKDLPYRQDFAYLHWF